MLPLPISNMSGSFQCPGPACCSKPTCLSKPIVAMLFQRSSISPVVRHRFPPEAAPHSQTFRSPYWHKLKTMGRPVGLQGVAHFFVNGRHLLFLVDLFRAAPIVLEIIDAPASPGTGILLFVLVA